LGSQRTVMGEGEVWEEEKFIHQSKNRRVCPKVPVLGSPGVSRGGLRSLEGRTSAERKKKYAEERGKKGRTLSLTLNSSEQYPLANFRRGGALRIFKKVVHQKKFSTSRESHESAGGCTREMISNTCTTIPGERREGGRLISTKWRALPAPGGVTLEDAGVGGAGKGLTPSGNSYVPKGVGAGGVALIKGKLGVGGSSFGGKKGGYQVGKSASVK